MGSSKGEDIDGISIRLRLVREHAGLSQNLFAERIGYSRRQVVAWEKAVSAPSIWALIAIRREWDIDPEWILSGPGEIPLSDILPEDRLRFRRFKRFIETLANDYRVVLTSETVNTLTNLLLRIPVHAENEARVDINKMLVELLNRR